jgi:outer membrane protein assembly factor BamB
MKKKLVGILVCMLVIGTTLTTIGMANQKQVFRNKIISTYDEHSWPMFHYNLSRNGYSPSSAPNTNNVSWSYEIPGRKETVDSSPVIVNGKVYIGSHDANLTCLDAIVGSVLWRQKIGNGIYTASTIVDDKLYLTADPGFVFCLNAITGTMLWNYTTKALYMDSSPAVVNGKVYIGAGRNDGNIYCLDASTGGEQWKYQTGNSVYSSPAYFDGKIYIGSEDKNVYCLNASTGSKLWNFSMAGLCFLSSPAYFDGKIYIGSQDKNMYCLNATTGNKLWNFTTSNKVDSSPAIAYGKVYFGSYDSYVYCVDASTGGQIWKYKTMGAVTSSPAIAGGKIYLGSFDHNFYCLNAITGNTIWTYDAGKEVSSSPAVADGALYIGGVVNGRIYCFKDGTPGSPDTPTITGPAKGKVKVPTKYNFTTTDPNGDEVSYYIDWGDGTSTGWIGPYPSGDIINKSHTWSKKGDYSIKAKAKNSHGNESGWGTLSVKMPCSYNIPMQWFWARLFERFPNAFPILRHLLGY